MNEEENKDKRKIERNENVSYYNGWGVNNITFDREEWKKNHKYVMWSFILQAREKRKDSSRFPRGSSKTSWKTYLLILILGHLQARSAARTCRAVPPRRRRLRGARLYTACTLSASRTHWSPAALASRPTTLPIMTAHTNNFIGKKLQNFCSLLRKISGIWLFDSSLFLYILIFNIEKGCLYNHF